VLDGGFREWAQKRLPVTHQPHPPTPSEWTGARAIHMLADWRDVSERLDRADAIIVDTRSDGEYRGTTVRAARGGAIPGAVHLEWTNNLSSTGAFKSPGELKEMYEAAGVTPDCEVVTYCQGGYRAAHSYLALRLAGYPRVRNYIGSWKEWGDRVDLPIEQPKES
jgi:thiosulfate/3-mercaptopyruvate sulfurtransferase